MSSKTMGIFLITIVTLITRVEAQCGYQSRCGGYQAQYMQHMVQPQQFVQPLPQPVIQPQPIDYYYRTANTYTQPPAEVVAGVEKEITTASIAAPKSVEYEDIDKKIGEFKTTLSEESASAVESPTASPASTYIRETAVYQPYVPRQVAYRPQPLPQAGCGAMTPQYYRPAPYMPRGYMIPYTPTYATHPPPPPQPLPTLIQPPRYNAPVNDCCGRCSAPCGHGVRRFFAKSAKTVQLNGMDSKTEKGRTEVAKDPRCTNKELKEVMDKVSHKTPSLAKRLIQRIAEEKFGGYFSVICSKEDFTYVSRGEMYCQTENNGVVCYAFKHH
ncbi:hypothetical protein RB195_016113 [Necator americanus]|uniref:Ground-like domain-containing protein n=1 Tax=Necator americanus TaxID=51031 RepID=A0ABR1E7M9_NECAM